MKILLLSPKINAEHKIAKIMQSKGVGLLFPADAAEAWQMIQMHGESLDLAVIHREIDTDLKLIAQIKADPTHLDLPILITTDLWSGAECAQHQESVFGVNAYLSSS